MAGPAYGANWGWDWTQLTNIDMTGNQFKFVTLASTGYLTVSTAGQLAIGVIQDAPVGTTAVPLSSQVRTGGPTKVQCGGSFNAGDLLSSDASGKAVLYTGAKVFTGTPYIVSGTQVLGIALQSGAASSDSAMLFRPSGLAA